MGQTVSTFPVRFADFPFFSITFRSSDTIKVVDAPTDIVALIRSVISRFYTDGIQREIFGRSENCIDFKLHGYPFSKGGSRNKAISTKKMCCALLEELHSRGWELTLSSDLGRHTDLSTLFFQRNPNLQAECKIFCLSLSDSDKLQVINAPRQSYRVLIDCVGELHQRDYTDLDYFEVVMKGYLWTAATMKSCYQARAVLLQCFHKFHTFGYRYYGTANIKGTADCIFFIADDGDVGPRQYCVLSLNSNDGIRFIGAPREVVFTVKQCVDLAWPKGIQDCGSKFADSFELKLKGHPWDCSGDEAVASRLLITLILEKLCTIGWGVIAALDVSRRANDKAVFVLRRCTPTTIPHFSICPSDTDKIRIINASKEIVERVTFAIRRSWTLGIQRECINHGCYEMKLFGSPWSASNCTSQFELARLMMARLLFEFALLGWRVVCSADVSSKFVSDGNGNSFSIDVHSWFVAYTGCSQSNEPGSRPRALSLPSASSAPELSFLGNGGGSDFRRGSHSGANCVSPPPSYAEAMALPSYNPPAKRWES